MSNYSQSTFFTAKDALLTGDPLKLIKGVDFDGEFSAVSTAIGTKVDTGSGGVDVTGTTASLDLSSLSAAAGDPVSGDFIAGVDTSESSDSIKFPITSLATMMAADNDDTGLFSAAGVLHVAIAATTVTTPVGSTDKLMFSDADVGGGLPRGALIDDVVLAGIESAVSNLPTSQTAQAAVGDYFVVDDGGTTKKVLVTNMTKHSENQVGSFSFDGNDCGGIKFYTGSGGVNATMNSGIGIDGSEIIIINTGAGVLTLVSGTATIHSRSSLLALQAKGTARLIRKDSTNWYAEGDLA